MKPLILSALMAAGLLCLGAVLTAQVAPSIPSPVPASKPPVAAKPAQSAKAASPGSPQFADLAKKATAARQGDHLDEAIALYRKAVQVKPTWTEGWWYLSSLLYDQDRYVEARDGFRRFTSLDPASGAGAGLLGLCEFQTKEYDPAFINLRKASALGTEGNEQMMAVIRFHLALLFTRREQYENALALLLEFARRGREDITMIEAAGIAGLRKPVLPIELPADEREVAVMTGKALFNAAARKPAAAEASFQEALARYPKTPNIHYLHGKYLMLSEPDKGVEQMQKELEIDPTNLPALVDLSVEFLRRKEPGKALGYGREAARVAPTSFAARNVYGRVLVENGDVENGIRELEESRTLAPDSPQTRIALASAYAKAGRKEDAARERAEFLRLKKISDARTAKADEQRAEDPTGEPVDAAAKGEPPQNAKP